jgi:hypothetical protein
MFNIMYGLSHLTSFYYFSIEWVGLLCLTLLSTIFQLYRGGHFHWCRKPEYAEKTTDLPQVTEKLYTLSHNAVSSTPRLNGIRTYHVSGNSTDCIDSCKSNYHTTAPDFSIVFWNVLTVWYF